MLSAQSSINSCSRIYVAIRGFSEYWISNWYLVYLVYLGKRSEDLCAYLREANLFHSALFDTVKLS